MRFNNLITIAVLLAVFCSVSTAKIIYVDDDAAGADDGTSWENAYIYLQDALADVGTAEKPVEICVAQGIYKPDQGATQTPGDCDATFQLINDVTIKGGYAGIGEIDPNVYNVELYQTILSGDLDGNDSDDNNPFDITRAENSCHVLTAVEADKTAVLKGFTITKGNGLIIAKEDAKDGGGMYSENSSPNLICCTFISNSGMCGGAMYNLNSSPILTECEFIENVSPDGAGIYNKDHSNPRLIHCIFTRNFSAIGSGMSNFKSSPDLTNCIFISNVSDTRGGGISNSQYSNPILTNCKFTGNKSAYGGGIYNEENSMLVLKGCTFSGNLASIWGGGMYNYASEPTLTNCTLVGNSAEKAGDGIFNGDSNLTLTNCILRDGGNEIWHDDDSMIIVTYSNIQGSWEGEGNIDQDPLFAKPGYWANANDPNMIAEPNDPNAVWLDGDYHLKSEVGRWNPDTQTWVTDDVTSPCIDAGDPNSDWTGETWPNGGRINMGAYGGTREASMSTQTNGMSLPHVVFIYKYDSSLADSFKSLLEMYGAAVAAVSVFNFEQVSLTDYDLIIVGEDASGLESIDSGMFNAAVESSGKPVVGLGNDGYDFFGELDLSIGSPYGGHGSRNGIRVIEPECSLFSTPYQIEIPNDQILQLYTETNSIGIYLWPEIPETITVIGSEPDDAGYYPLLMEHNRYLLWGFTESPQKMTEVGKRLFINVVIWTANLGWESEN